MSLLPMYHSSRVRIRQQFRGLFISSQVFVSKNLKNLQAYWHLTLRLRLKSKGMFHCLAWVLQSSNITFYGKLVISHHTIRQQVNNGITHQASLVALVLLLLQVQSQVFMFQYREKNNTILIIFKNKKDLQYDKVTTNFSLVCIWFKFSTHQIISHKEMARTGKYANIACYVKTNKVKFFSNK